MGIFADIGIFETFAVILFFIGFFGLITSNSIIKSIVSIVVMEVAIVLFILSIGFIEGMLPPVSIEPGSIQTAYAAAGYFVDPLPQAMVITAIIIGVTVTAVNVTMLISLSRRTNSTDWDQCDRNRCNENENVE